MVLDQTNKLAWENRCYLTLAGQRTKRKFDKTFSFRSFSALYALKYIQHTGVS